jgi:predicted nucleic acid-binding protein
MIVVDTNIIGYFFLDSDFSSQVEKAYQKDSHWAAPLLWRSEFRNVLAAYIRQNLLTLADANQIMTEAETLLKNQEYTVNSTHVLRLVADSSCSAYDCEFVALAQDLGVSVVTPDKKILADFPTIAISLDQFSKPA